jgi:hypothetical protein
MAIRKRNKIVEIYFILYLAALVFLIPGKNKNMDGNSMVESQTRIFQLPFSLKPEKNALLAVIKLDSNGINISSIDSVNTIFYTGAIKDIKFDVSIEDRSSRQILAINEESGGNNLFFKYYTDKNSQSLKFIWNPQLYDRKSKTYIVKVSAQAVSNEPGNEGQILEDMVQFSLNLNYLNDFGTSSIIASDNSAIQQIIDSTNLVGIKTYTPPENLFMTPREELIKSIAYGTWENEISIFGLDPKIDLRKQPEIKLIREPDNRIGGNAKIVGFTSTSILLQGETPGFGVLKVAISLTRHSDGKEAIREFKVVPQLIEDPKFEQVLYPGIKYTFDPKLPVISGQRTYASLKSNDGKLFSSSENGSKFSITPSINDTGKILFFERFIDNNLIGQRYSIKINMFPQPEISRFSETGKNMVRIFTNCYGIYQGNENYISRIEVIQGNAKVREIIGAQKNEDGKFVFKQVFEIVPANANSEFTFKIQAVAQNGQKSEIVVYPNR